MAGKNRTRLILRYSIGVGVLIVFVIWALIGAATSRQFVRPPDFRFESDDQYFEQISAPPTIAAASADLSEPVEILPGEKENTLIVRHREQRSREPGISRVSRNDNPDTPWSVELSSGEVIRLLEVEIEYATGPDQTRAQRFRPGESMPFLDEPRSSRNRHAKNGTYSIALTFETSEWIANHVDHNGCFGAQSNSRMVSTFGGSRGGSKLLHTVNVYHWHDGPVNFVFDVACGEPVEIEVDPRQPIPQLLDFGQGLQLQILDIRAGDWSGSSTKGDRDSTFSLTTMHIDFTAKDHTSMTLLPSHPKNTFGFEVAALDSSGKVIAGPQKIRGMDLVGQSLRADLDAIDRLQLRCAPNFDRVIFQLPQIPGLPDANHDVDNLFDSEIPYFRPETPQQYENFIRAGAQVFWRFRPGLSEADFPMEFTAASIHEILEFADTRRDGRPLVIQEGVIIKAPEPAWKTRITGWWEGVKTWFSD